MDFRIQAALVTAAAVVITAVTSQAIKIFSDFNCLNERYQLIARSPEYGPSRGQRLVDEQKEQADLAAEIEQLLAELVPAIRI